MDFDLSKPNRRLFFLRKTFDLTLRNLALVLDKCYITVHKWEHYDSIAIDIKTYQRFLAIGINPMYIIANEHMLLDGFTENMVKDKINTILSSKKKGA